LKKQLKERGIDTSIINNNRVVLAEILQNKLNDEMSEQNTGKSLPYKIVVILSQI
jgi:hypothetical protein